MSISGGSILDRDILMGQASSQPAAPPSMQVSTMPEEAREESIKSDQPNPVMKKRKRKSKSSGDQSHGVDEEESARLLMSLSCGKERDTNGLDADDVAASAQLIAESSPFQLYTEKEVKKQAGKFKNLTNGKKSAAKRQPLRRSKRGGASPESSSATQADVVAETDGQDDGNGLVDVVEENAGGLESPVFPPKQPELPPSTLRLDDIDSEDESVASYLREYEEAGQVTHAVDQSKTAPHREEAGFKKLGDPSNALLDDEPESSVYMAYHLPSATERPCTTKRDKTRRERETKNMSEPTIINSDDDGPALANGTNQITLEGEPRRSRDFETIAHAALHHIDQDINIDPALRSYKPKHKRKNTSELPHSRALNGSSGIPNGIGTGIYPDRTSVGNNLSVLGRENGINRDGSDEDPSAFPTKKGNLKRVSHKRKRPTETNHDGYITPYPTSDVQQDQVLPGYEDATRQGSPELGEPKPQQPAKKKAKRRMSIAEQKPSPNRSDSELRASGPFSSIEIAELEGFKDAYCEEHKLTSRQFNERIQLNAKSSSDLTTFWSDIQQVLPKRQRLSIQKFCRRHFHNYAVRAKWTKEDDEMLRQAVEEKGKHWKMVGDIIERMPEDCRDRYRNYIINAETRNSESWTEIEVRNLCLAVDDCIQAMRDEKQRLKQEEHGAVSDVNLDEIEEMKLINWQAVSDRMGNTRSRLQCSYKWGKMKAEDKEAYKILAAADVPIPTNRTAKKRNRKSWRMVRANKAVHRMLPGDEYDLLQVLAQCPVGNEGNIPWQRLGAEIEEGERLRSRWTTVERKAAWEMLKARVPVRENMAWKDIVDLLLTKLLTEEGNRLDERVAQDTNTAGEWNGPRNGRLRRNRGKDIKDAIQQGQDGLEGTDYAHTDYDDERRTNGFPEDYDSDTHMIDREEPPEELFVPETAGFQNAPVAVMGGGGGELRGGVGDGEANLRDLFVQSNGRLRGSQGEAYEEDGGF